MGYIGQDEDYLESPGTPSCDSLQTSNPMQSSGTTLPSPERNKTDNISRGGLAMSRPTLQRATIAPDYPNFGEYQRDVYAMGYASASMKAIWNNIRAVDVLTERPDVDAV